VVSTIGAHRVGVSATSSRFHIQGVSSSPWKTQTEIQPTGMLYNKTPKAWASLAQPALMGRLAHTVVLMANGRRSLRELSLLTGTDVTEQAYLLPQAGYLEVQDPPRAQPAD
jgi:hypothetical protein